MYMYGKHKYFKKIHIYVYNTSVIRETNLVSLALFLFRTHHQSTPD